MLHFTPFRHHATLHTFQTPCYTSHLSDTMLHFTPFRHHDTLHTFQTPYFTSHLSDTMLHFTPFRHHATFNTFQAPCFTSIQDCWPYITLINSPFQLKRKYPATQQHTALPTLNRCMQKTHITVMDISKTGNTCNNKRYIKERTFGKHTCNICEQQLY